MLATPKQPWITPELAKQIETVRQQRIRCDPDYPANFKAVKKEARKLKRDWTRSQLTKDSDTAHAHVWRVTRQLKKGFQGKRTRLKKHGKPVPWTHTHTVFRDQLNNVQWGTVSVTDEEIKLLEDSPQLHPQETTAPPQFTHEELTTVLKQLRNNKAAGLDGTKAELLLLLDHVGELILLDILNECYRSKTVPHEWKQALVVSIYKGKGSESDPANYRPISLLNVMYKVYAALLQKRLAAAHDHKLRVTQFGFRQHKSTQEPIFILRRLQDYSAKTGQHFHMLFLDWKQAFDKIDHRSMLIALKRIGVHEHYLAIIKDLYTDPEFCTQGYNAQREWGKVKTGIRQGCPMSPYLFIIVMTVLFDDVDKRLRTHGVPQNTWSVGKPVYDLEYADDTVLMAVTTHQLQEMLHAVQVEASLYGLELNKEKTELLVPDYSATTICFADGTAVPTTTSAKYLGTQISWTTPPKIAINFRKSKAEAAFSKLYHVWNCKLPKGSKSRIFHSAILPIYTYSLATCSLDKQHFRTIHGWYFRHLRRALGIKHSYYSRIPNVKVWKTAGRPFIPSQTIYKQQFQLLLKSLTTPPNQPVHHVVFSPGFKDRIKFTKSKSRGHPARYWYELVSKEAVRFYQYHLDHHAMPERRRDFLGLIQFLRSDSQFGDTLTTAPTRKPEIFPMFSTSVGSAWQA